MSRVALPGDPGDDAARASGVVVTGGELEARGVEARGLAAGGASRLAIEQVKGDGAKAARG